MKVIVYGDFNCPYSYLASQRADRLIRGGIARVDWRVVEHDRGLALTGTSADPDRGTWDKELAEVARQRGEIVRSGVDGLGYLLALAGTAGETPLLPEGAETERHAGRRHLEAGRAA